ncbi:MAG: hypothetical protein WCW40_12360 [Bacteroidota bacterium]
MKKLSLVTIAGIFVLMGFHFSGCSSSELVDIWSDSSFNDSALNKIYVISASTNYTQRRIWEDAFCVELTKHYVDAVPSYRSFPDAVPDTTQIMDAVTLNGFNGVIVIRRLPPEIHAQFLQGYSTTEQRTYFDRRRSRFVTYYKEIEHSGHIDSQKVDINSIDVWTINNDGEMIWSATSKTVEPNSGQNIRMEIAQLVMTELANRGIIVSRR